MYMKLIELGGKNGIGKVTIVDDEDYEWLKQQSWHGIIKTSGTYVKGSIRINKKAVNKFIHRYIMGLENNDKRIIDHKDRNPLNNQKSNLRICTFSENVVNREKKQIGAKSKYLGVTISYKKRSDTKSDMYWRAACMKDGKRYFKYCNTEIEAALAYNEMAVRLYGEFANPNIIDWCPVTTKSEQYDTESSI